MSREEAREIGDTILKVLKFDLLEKLKESERSRYYVT